MKMSPKPPKAFPGTPQLAHSGCRLVTQPGEGWAEILLPTPRALWSAELLTQGSSGQAHHWLWWCQGSAGLQNCTRVLFSSWLEGLMSDSRV